MTTAYGPLRTFAREAGSVVADSVQPIPVHVGCDPAPSWCGVARGAVKAPRRRQGRARVTGAVNENSLNGGGHPGMALLAPCSRRRGHLNDRCRPTTACRCAAERVR